MVDLLQSHWDLADRSHRVMSAHNRKRTSQEAMPRIDLGDYVLYPVHKKPKRNRTNQNETKHTNDTNIKVPK